MTDYYTTLGVDKNASQEEIKKAYKKLANTHHPDKGGDQAKFKEIANAYDIIGDTQKRSEYDNMQSFGNSYGPRHHTYHQDFNDIFSQQFGTGNPFSDIFGRHQQRTYKNRDLNLTCEVSFVDSYVGKQLEATYTLPSGRPQSVVINVPAGVEHGNTIKYSGLGDDSIAHLPRGDLNVTILVSPDNRYKRVGNDIYTEVEINAIEAMIGCRKEVTFITNEKMTLEIRQGIESGVEYAKSGAGFTNVHTGHKGRFVSVIKIVTPVINDPSIIERLKQILNEITHS